MVAEQNESYDSEGTKVLRAGVLKNKNTSTLMRRASNGFAGQAPHFGRSPKPRSFVLCSEVREHRNNSYSKPPTYKLASIGIHLPRVNPVLLHKFGARTGPPSGRAKAPTNRPPE